MPDDTPTGRIATPAQFLRVLARAGLIDTVHLAELPTTYADVREAGRDLLDRGWLTAYQVNHVLQGREAQLVVGPFHLLDRIGEGGMGQVFRARHARLGTIVALKVVRPSRVGDSDAVRRFLRELRLVASLDHPNIVHALDAGEHEGTPYLAMELVGGTDLSRLVRAQGPLSLPQACDVARQAALGLQHAHERGMIHRDIKPANLLLTPAGQVKVLDFGLARRVENEGEESSTLTETGTVMGTPDFLAPEQIRDSHRVDTRADLYSLGCTLYFLIAGGVPFPGGTLGLKLVRHQTDEPEPIEAIRPEVPASLAAIVQKLMAKRPEDRYQTPAEAAAALAALSASGDLTRGMWGGLKGAGRFGPTWHGKRLGLAAGAGLLVVAMMAGLSAWLLRPGPPDPVPPPSPDTRTVLERLTHKAIPEGERPGWLPAEVVQVLGTHRGRHWGRVNDVIYSPDGVRAFSCGSDRTIRVWDAETLREYTALPDEAPAQSLVLVGDGSRTTLRACGPGRVLSYDAETFRSLPTSMLTDQPGRLSADGKYALSAVGPSVLVEVATGREIKRLPGLAAEVGPYGAAFTPGSDRALVALPEGGGAVLDTKSGEQVGRLPAMLPASKSRGGVVKRMAVTPDGKRALCSDFRGNLTLYDLSTFAVVSRLRAVADAGTATWGELAIAADGRRAVVAPSDTYPLELWDLRDGKRVRTLGKGAETYTAVAIRPDGKRALTGDSLGRLRLWDLDTGEEIVPEVGPSFGPAYRVALSPDGRWAVSGHIGGTLVGWDVASGKALRVSPPSLYHSAIAFSPDGTRYVVANSWGDLRVRDRESNELIWQSTQPPGVNSLAFSQDGKRLYVGRNSLSLPAWKPEFGAIRILDAATGEPVGTLEGHTMPVNALAVSPDGTRLASASGNSTPIGEHDVRVWDLATGKEIDRMEKHIHAVTGVAFSPDGKRVASVSHDRQMILWEPGTKKPPIAVRWDAGVAVVFDRDGYAIASGDGGRLVVVDPAGEVVAERRFAGSLWGLAIAADGRHLLTANANGTCYVMRLPLRPKR